MHSNRSGEQVGRSLWKTSVWIRSYSSGNTTEVLYYYIYYYYYLRSKKYQTNVQHKKRKKNCKQNHEKCDKKIIQIQNVSKNQSSEVLLPAQYHTETHVSVCLHLCIPKPSPQIFCMLKPTGHFIDTWLSRVGEWRHVPSAMVESAFPFFFCFFFQFSAGTS